MAEFRGSMASLGNLHENGSLPVADDDRARLMFYLNCLSGVLKFPDNSDVAKMTRYQDYQKLTGKKEVEALVKICKELSPACLFGKCVVLADDLQEYETSTFSIVPVSSKDIPENCKYVVYNAGIKLKVKGYITVHPAWLLQYYEKPMKSWKTKAKGGCVIS